MRILFLDDSKLTRAVMGQTLRHHRHEVFTASTVDEAKKLLQEMPFDLLITDLNMPGDDDGLAFASWVRHCPQREKTPVMLITADFDPALTRRAQDAGVNLFVQKSFSPEDMAEAIDKALDGLRNEGRLRPGNKGE